MSSSSASTTSHRSGAHARGARDERGEQMALVILIGGVGIRPRNIPAPARS
jgi:hypothetical protein